MQYSPIFTSLVQLVYTCPVYRAKYVLYKLWNSKIDDSTSYFKFRYPSIIDFVYIKRLKSHDHFKDSIPQKNFPVKSMTISIRFISLQFPSTYFLFYLYYEIIINRFIYYQILLQWLLLICTLHYILCSESPFFYYILPVIFMNLISNSPYFSFNNWYYNQISDPPYAKSFLSFLLK